MWSLDFIAPSILCTTQGSECIPTSYPNPKRAVKIEADGSDPSEPQPPNKQDPTVKLQYLKGPVSIHLETRKKCFFLVLIYLLGSNNQCE